MQRKTVYESSTAKVISVGEIGAGICCVTFFTYASDESSLSQVKGFGEDILARIGIPSVHFINLQNHWWHIRDLDDCINAGASALEGSTRRIGYGSSMGAYAVLRFSDQLRIDESLCFSPQFSIDGAKVPFEKRWRKQAGGLDFSGERMAIRENSRHHIIFDPRCDDAAHIELITSANPAADIRAHRVCAGDHLVIREYQRTGLLTEALKSMLSGTVDEGIIRQHPEYLDCGRPPSPESTAGPQR